MNKVGNINDLKLTIYYNLRFCLLKTLQKKRKMLRYVGFRIANTFNIGNRYIIQDDIESKECVKAYKDMWKKLSLERILEIYRYKKS